MLELAALGQRLLISLLGRGSRQGSGDIWHEGTAGKKTLQSMQHPHVLLTRLKIHEAGALCTKSV